MNSEPRLATKDYVHHPFMQRTQNLVQFPTTNKKDISASNK